MKFIKEKIGKLIFFFILTFLFVLPLSLAQATDLPTSRLSGKDEFERAVQISKESWLTADFAILVSTSGLIDAIPASSLGGILNAPILLTKKDALPSVTKTEIQRLGVKNVYLIGGEGVISQNIEDELNKMELNVIRFSGKNRFETAVRIAEETKSLLGGEIPDGTALLVNGISLTNSLAISPLASNKRYPILLTLKDSLPDFTKNALNEFGVSRTILIGETETISSSIEKLLPQPMRLSGKDRYEIATKIIDYSLGVGFSSDKVYVVASDDLSSALAGGVLAGKNSFPLLLVPGKAPIPDALQAWMNKKRSSFGSVLIIGGKEIVSSEIEQWIKTGVLPPPSPAKGLPPKGKSVRIEKIVISISSQTLTAYNGSDVIYKFPVSTGTRSHPTPLGSFRVSGKYRMAWSKKYHAWMPYCLVFWGPDYTIHELPIGRSGRRMGVRSLGRRASHGCVRLGIGPAEKIYKSTPIGAKVYVVR